MLLSDGAAERLQSRPEPGALAAEAAAWNHARSRLYREIGS